MTFNLANYDEVTIQLHSSHLVIEVDVVNIVVVILNFVSVHIGVSYCQ